MDTLKTKTTSTILDLPEKDLVVLQDLAKKKGLTFDALIRQAYRQYQSIDYRLSNGLITMDEYKRLFDTGIPHGCSGDES